MASEMRGCAPLTAWGLASTRKQWFAGITKRQWRLAVPHCNSDTRLAPIQSVRQAPHPRPLRIAAVLSASALAVSALSMGLASCDMPARSPAPQVARETARQPARPSGTASPGPVVTLRPDSGPVGTRIRVEGSEFPRYLAGERTVIVTLNREFPGGCGLVGGVRVISLHISKQGQLHGRLVITAHGDCFQEPGRHHAVTPGRYQLAIGCMACDLRSFLVTRR